MDAEQPDRHHAHEVQRPVLRVEQRGGDHGDGDEVARPRRGHRPLQGEEAQPGQEDDQRVHARLGRVVDREGRAGQQHQHRPGHRAAPEALAAEPCHRECEHGEDARERAHGVVGLPEEHDPEVQEVVVRGRGPVVLERVRGSRAAGGGRCRPSGPRPATGPTGSRSAGRDRPPPPARRATPTTVRVRPLRPGTSSGMGRMVGHGVAV